MDYSKANNKKRMKKGGMHRKRAKNRVVVLITRVFLIVILILGFAGAGAGIGAYMGIIESTPKLSTISIQPNVYTTIVYEDKTGAEIDRLTGDENREYVTFDKIPQDLKNAFVAIEDERFYEHDGIDFRGIARALYSTVQGDTQGASTITQQLIKNSITKVNRNTFESKLKEQYLAIEYEKSLVAQYDGNKVAAKNHILELYLNTIALHHNLNGVQTASNYYFDKDVSELTLSESAVIAAITQNPSKYAPDIHPEENKKRQTAVLDKMLELGMITQQQHDDALADDVYSRVSNSKAVQEDKVSFHSYFVDALVSQISTDLQEQKGYTAVDASNMIYNGGLQIYATQDMDMQQIMDADFLDDSLFPPQDFEIDVQYTLSYQNKITGKTNREYRVGKVKTADQIDGFVQSVKDEVLGPDDKWLADEIIPVPQPQAAMIIIDYHTGEVKAMTGGRGEKLANRSLNRAVDSERQPGSVFKVLASYAPAIDMGRITPSTIIVDEPFSYNGKEFKNWYGGYRGPATVRDGIRNSMNVITVKNMVDTGIDACIDYLKNFGFTTIVDNEVIDGKVYTDHTPAACLGGLTNGVKQIEVAAAYGTIANGGIYNKPVLYTKVLNHDGTVLLENQPESRQVLKPTSAYMLTDMMKDVITNGTGGKAAFKHIKMPLAGKTGTTTDTKDLTFVGYTPYYVGSIWMGFDTPKTIKEDKGYHMRLWSDVMEKIHQNLPIKDFSEPTGMVSVAICERSGKLAITGICDKIEGNTIKNETFAAGSQPMDSCDVHVSVTIDTSTGQKANPYCPEEYHETLFGEIGQPAVNDPKYILTQELVDGPECKAHGSHAASSPQPAETLAPSADGADPNSTPPAIDNSLVTTPKPDAQPPAADGGQTNGAEGAQPNPAPTPIPEYSPPAEVPVLPDPNGGDTGGDGSDTAPLIDEPASQDGFSY